MNSKRTFLRTIHLLIPIILLIYFVNPIQLKAPENNLEFIESVWWNHDWSYRAKAVVDQEEFSEPFTITEINFTYLFSRLGIEWLVFDESSIKVVEYNLDGTIKNDNVLFEFYKSNDFDPKSNAFGYLSWDLKKENPSNKQRLFYVYFDSLKDGIKSVAHYESFFPESTYLNGAFKGILQNENQPEYFQSIISHAPDKLQAPKFPEVRGIWYHPLATKYEISEQQIADDLNRLKEARFNIIFVWISNLYAEALRNPGLYGSEIPHALWDSLKVLMEQAHENGLKVHLWYAINNYKEPHRATELRVNPAWAPLNRSLSPVNGGIDLAIKEARDYEKDTILYLIKRYNPDGFHIEEPYYHSYNPINTSYSQAFRDLVEEKFGFDPLAHPVDEELEMALASIKEEVMTNFFIDLRETLYNGFPELVLSANGPWYGAANQGLNLIRWAEDRLIDFYVPQIYTTDPKEYREKLKTLIESLGNFIHIYGGTGIKWASLRGWNPKESVKKQIETVQNIGANGIVFFSFGQSANNPFYDFFELVEDKPLNYEVTNGFHLKGKVLNNSAPIPNVHVRILNQNTITDIEGRFVLYTRAGKHTIEAFVEGYKVLEADLVVRGNTYCDILVSEARIEKAKREKEKKERTRSTKKRKDEKR